MHTNIVIRYLLCENFDGLLPKFIWIETGLYAAFGAADYQLIYINSNIILTQ